MVPVALERRPLGTIHKVELAFLGYWLSSQGSQSCRRSLVKFALGPCYTQNSATYALAWGHQLRHQNETGGRTGELGSRRMQWHAHHSQLAHCFSLTALGKGCFFYFPDKLRQTPLHDLSLDSYSFLVVASDSSMVTPG